MTREEKAKLAPAGTATNNGTHSSPDFSSRMNTEYATKLELLNCNLNDSPRGYTRCWNPYTHCNVLCDTGAVKQQRTPLLELDSQGRLVMAGGHSAEPTSISTHQPSTKVDVASFTKPFLSFISNNPTVFHAVAHVCERLESHGFIKLSERKSWTSQLSRGGKYFFERNGSSLIAFQVGDKYESGNGASVIASHIDALTTRLKPIPTLTTKAGYVQLGVAPYAGALNNTWWDRDLGVGGRVLVKDNQTGKIETKLVKLGWPIARIPTLAPHFGAAANLSNPNKETEMVPIIGLESADSSQDNTTLDRDSSMLGGAGTFAATQPPRLVKAIAGELDIQDCEQPEHQTHRQQLTPSR